MLLNFFTKIVTFPTTSRTKNFGIHSSRELSPATYRIAPTFLDLRGRRSLFGFW